MNHALRLIIIIYCLTSQTLSAQTSLIVGVGYEINTVSGPSSIENSFFNVPTKDMIFDAPVVEFIVRRSLSSFSEIQLGLCYSQHRFIGFQRGGINPSVNEFGFRRFSVQPQYVYSRYENIGLTVGLDITTLFNHYRAPKSQGRSFVNAKRPEDFNTQFGVVGGFTYGFKRFSVGLQATFGLLYRKEYSNYINEVNFYRLSFCYSLKK
ncbi:hypothetical protein [Lewinella sp. 4G2]|uniref:hypothetical protein n=1 Tax=Lewinella sp. 4G2 TaxID=1803372 RepID=UPI0012F79774|nr:hypothetical protein [Lewinella sp. 4G2]